MSIATEVFRGYGGGGTVDARVRRGFASYSALPQPPLTGFEYQDCTTTAFVGDSLQIGVSPAVIVGDVFVVALATSPSGFAITVNGDGTVTIATGGNTSRQSFPFYLLRSLANTLDGPGLVWDHEVPPAWGLPVAILGQLINTPIAVNLAGAPYATSSEGDTLTFALSSGALPAGVTLSSAGLLSGTPTVLGTFSFTITATDITGSSTPSPVGQIVMSNAFVPSVVGLPEATALAVLASAGLIPGSITLFNSSFSFGLITGQSPAAGSVLVPGTVVNLTESLGPQVTNPALSSLINRPVTTRQFSWKEMVVRQWGSEYSAPDHRIYQFTGRNFDSTDLYMTGIYRPPGFVAPGERTPPVAQGGYILTEDGSILEAEDGAGLLF